MWSLVLCVWFACAQAPDCGCEALEERVARLEAALEQKEGLPAGERPPPVVLSQGEEEEAAKAAMEAQRAADAGDLKRASTLAKELAESRGQSRASKALSARARGWALAGSEAPEVSGRWLLGDGAPLQGARAVVYVSFDVSCPLCKPELTRIKGLGREGLVWVAVTSAERGGSDEALRAALAEAGFSGPALVDARLVQGLSLSPAPMAAAVVGGEVAWWGPVAKIDEAKVSGWLDPVER